MLFSKRKSILITVILLFFLAISFGYVKAAYLTTNRDTKLPPDKVTYDIVKYDDYEKLYETDTLAYYYREDRDIFAIEDKRNGYTWKTGLDIPFGQEIQNEVMAAATPEEAQKLAQPVEDRMNSTYTALANSLLTLEYDNEGKIARVSSAATSGVESELVTLNDNPATRRLDMNFINLDVKVKLYITFMEDSIHYEIKNEELTGKGVNKVLAFIITPFLGASGGKTKEYNPDTQMYDITKDKYMIPGYIFVPDGSGALIRFKDNTASFTEYVGDVYGVDPAQNATYDAYLEDAVPLKEPVMPVFGAAHGNGQAAFVAYADSGDEYMQIVVKPEENLTNYNWVYPRFVNNVQYWQIYNKQGSTFSTIMDEPNKFNVDLTYTFLSGDGSDGKPAADYTGMAAVYRKHLIDTGILTENKATSQSDIPLRLDFIMSDSKKGIVSTEEVAVTNTEDVREILTDVTENLDIRNINSGLYGWQKDGETIAKPDSNRYSGKVGNKNDFKKLITDFSEQNIDISLARDYMSINHEMTSYLNTAARHVNSWYLLQSAIYILPNNVPVNEFGYATPKKSVKWFDTLFKRQSSYVKSMTVRGISNALTSTYDSNGVVSTVTDAIAMYQEALGDVNTKVKLNLEAPNMYLWKYTDRYLKSPVGNSQYLFETDAVPFLQMVLQGTMEVYAPYSNFSFYTQKDILRMIDYNLSPSFILSKQPSYNLASTTSCDLYSTEYSQYQELIGEIYHKVDDILSQVQGYNWVGRSVPMDGTIVNTYLKDNEQKKVLINYTEDEVIIENQKVAPLSAVVIEIGEVR